MIKAFYLLSIPQSFNLQTSNHHTLPTEKEYARTQKNREKEDFLQKNHEKENFPQNSRPQVPPAGPPAYEVYSKLPKELREWIKENLAKQGIQRPLALLKSISPKELEENVEAFLKTEMDPEEYKFFENRLGVLDLAQYHLSEEKETFLAKKDEELLKAYRAWKKEKAVKGPINMIFMVIYKTLNGKPLPKDTFKETVKKLVMETVREKEKRTELVQIINELLRRLKDLELLKEYEEDGTTRVMLSVKDYENFSTLLTNELYNVLYRIEGASNELPSPPKDLSQPPNPEPEPERKPEPEDDLDLDDIHF